MAKASPTGPEEADIVVTGTLGAATRGVLVGSPPFMAGGGRFNLDVDCTTGSFVGTYQVTRSLDGGVSWRRCTYLGTAVSFTADISEVLQGVETAEMYDIEVTAYTSGALTYRFAA